MSTEDAEIKEVALKLGAKIDDRPEHMAGDTVTKVQVVKEYLERMTSIQNEDTITALLPTCPFRTNAHLKEAFESFLKHKDKLPFLIGVTEYEFPIQLALSKTGTTSLEKAFLDLGFQLGSQDKGTSLFQAWVDRDFNEICKFAKSADVFQDIPFSLPQTFIALERYFPNAKFILTKRDDENEWYESLVRFHIKLWGKEGQTELTREDLENATPYHYSRLYIVKKIYQK